MSDKNDPSPENDPLINGTLEYIELEDSNKKQPKPLLLPTLSNPKPQYMRLIQNSHHGLYIKMKRSHN